MNKIVKIGAVLTAVSLFSGVSSVAFASDKTKEKSATVGIAMDDAGLTAAVKAALVADSRTKAKVTHVKTVNNVIHLSTEANEVVTAEEKKAAEEIANKVATEHSKDGIKVTVDSEGLKVAQ